METGESAWTLHMAHNLQVKWRGFGAMCDASRYPKCWAKLSSEHISRSALDANSIYPVHRVSKQTTEASGLASFGFRNRGVGTFQLLAARNSFMSLF